MTSIKEIVVPDLGSISSAEIIEVLVQVGQKVEKEEALITLESEKASVDIPSPYAGRVKKVMVKKGDKVSQGNVIAYLEVATQDPQEVDVISSSAARKEGSSVEENPPLTQARAELDKAAAGSSDTSDRSVKYGGPALQKARQSPSKDVHAGPGVRRLASELGIDLCEITGSGQKGRILKEDLKDFIKSPQTNDLGSSTALQNDFRQFGEILEQPLSRIKKLTGKHLHDSWVSIPHVTQFGEADITELEAFRKAQTHFAAQRAVKLTLLAFIMKATVTSLKVFPAFNASLSEEGSSLLLKKYFHLGIAVDTEEGLVVPVLKDIDKKNLLELAKELGELSSKAREKQLKNSDLLGHSFTISSLGGIGGSAFTPIINKPDVAILGISRAQYRPCYRDNELVPRLMLPLSLSYDHRVIDGAEAARFVVHLIRSLEEIRCLLL